MSRHLSLPRRGHLDQLLNIHIFLKSHPYYSLVMNPAYMNLKYKFGKRSNKEDKRFEFYGDSKEYFPDNAPKSLGKVVDITGYVDANSADDQLSCQIHTGILIFINLAPILWHSKH